MAITTSILIHTYFVISRYALPQSPDGRRLAMSSETGQIFVFDLETNSLSAAFTSHAMSVRSVAWSPDSSVRNGFTWLTGIRIPEPIFPVTA